jgi:hypothetical protein
MRRDHNRFAILRSRARLLVDFGSQCVAEIACRAERDVAYLVARVYAEDFICLAPFPYPRGSGSMWGVNAALSSARGREKDQIIAMQYNDEHPKIVRSEAFGWYIGEPPSPMEAAYHFAEQAELDSANRSLYAEALGIFLAICWNIHPHQQQRAA